MNLSIQDAAREQPQRIGLVLIQGGAEAGSVTTYTFADLAEQAARVALPDLPCVPLCATLELSTLITLYALLERRVPALLLHPRWSRRETDAALADLNRVTLSARQAPGKAERAPERSGLEAVSTGAERQRCMALGSRSMRLCLDAPLSPDCQAIIYTSGSSGRPRGAMLGHAALRAAAEASAANLGWLEEDRWLLCMPLGHIGGLSIVTRCLHGRRAVVLGTPERIPEAIAQGRVTLMSLVPTQLQRLLRTDLSPPSHLRAILLGGAPASAALLDACAQRGWPVLPTYGMTETCAQVATQRPGAFNPAGGCGPPLPGIQVRVRDGEIAVRGPTLFSGYLGDPAPATDPDGWFATGDLGRLDHRGALHVDGRRGDLIIRGGENVYPAEVEGVLLQLPAVQAACVFGVPDQEMGQLVAAALVTSEPLDLAELSAHLQANLARFKQPRRLCVLPALPTLASGKPDRRRAAELALPLLGPI